MSKIEDKVAAEAALLQEQKEDAAEQITEARLLSQHSALTSVTTNSSTRQRLRWQPITSVSVVAQGEGVTTHPLLTVQNNWMVIMLVRQVMVDQPFAVPFGRSGEAWRACARSLSLAQDPDGN